MKKMVTNRGPGGIKKLDPLISKRSQFEKATSQLNSARNSTSVEKSNQLLNFAAGGDPYPPQTPSNISQIVVAAAELDNKSQSIK